MSKEVPVECAIGVSYYRVARERKGSDRATSIAVFKLRALPASTAGQGFKAVANPDSRW